MNTLLMVWLALGVTTLGLALYRKVLAMREDNYIHISDGEARYRAPQAAAFKRIGIVDRAGIAFTVATGVLGVILAGLVVWRALVPGA